MMDGGAGQQPEPEDEPETPAKGVSREGVKFSFSGAAASPLGKIAAEMKELEDTALGVDTSLNNQTVAAICTPAVHGV